MCALLLHVFRKFGAQGGLFRCCLENSVEGYAACSGKKSPNNEKGEKEIPAVTVYSSFAYYLFTQHTEAINHALALAFCLI